MPKESYDSVVAAMRDRRFIQPRLGFGAKALAANLSV
jgi:hypothetical protein